MRDQGLGKAPTQAALLKVIIGIRRDGGDVPGCRELAKLVNRAPSQVDGNINRLIEKGYLTCDRSLKGNVRIPSLRPTSKALDWLSASEDANELTVGQLRERDLTQTPVGGGAGAGNRRAAEADEADEYIVLPTRNVRHPGTYLVRVEGDSMSGDDLREGDHVVVDPGAPWGDGDMVVVLDQGEALVKRIYREGGSYILRSSNEAYPPIQLSPGAGHLGGQLVRGKVIGRVLWHTAPGHAARRD